MVTVFYGVLTVISCRLGGHGTMTLWWYVAVPIVSLSTAGQRSAIVWAGITVLSLGTFYALDCTGHTFPIDLTADQYRLLGLLASVGLVVLLITLAYLHETIRTQMLTQLTRTEATLRAEKVLSDTMVDSLPGIFYLVDEQGRFKRWNENLERVTGYSAEELLTVNALDSFRGDDRQIIGKALQHAFDDGHAIAEAALVARDGRAMPHFFTGRRVVLGGQPHAWSGWRSTLPTASRSSAPCARAKSVSRSCWIQSRSA